MATTKKDELKDEERRPLLVLDLVLFFVLVLVFAVALRNTHHPSLEWESDEGDTKVCKTRLLLSSVVCALAITTVTDISARSIGLQ